MKAVMENAITIRCVRHGDSTAIQAVASDWWGRPLESDMLSPSFLEHFHETCLIAERDGSMVGFLIGFLSQSHHDEAYIRLVVVHPEQRGTGVGKALYRQFFDVARRNNRLTVHAVTSPRNLASVAFHVHLGFTPTPQDSQVGGLPVARDYHGRPGTDRVVLVKQLI